MSPISRIKQQVEESFTEQKQILDFEEYLAEVKKAPWLHIRSSAQYLKDCFDFFGSYEVHGITGKIRRWRIFDQEFEGGGEKINGLEETQNKIYSQISSFAERGKTDKIILLHGPNATAKSSICAAIIAALEHYSKSPEGSIYTFHWLFSDNDGKSGLGFNKKRPGVSTSLAKEAPENIHFKIRSGLRESPLFLIPKIQRVELLQSFFKEHGRELSLNNPICKQEMGHKYYSIYTELLDNYHGDWEKVLRHVQIGRIFISKRYRTCAVTIEPQKNIDAQSKALTLERDFDIPISLKRANLHEVYGDLVDGNRGVIEYSDFLKRPMEVNKYLLTTAEQGTISLSSTVATLDVVLLATANEKHLAIFKIDPDFSSFKGRIEPIKVPYLKQWEKEADLYEKRIHSLARGKHVAPHTASFIGLWAVLTRLRKSKGQGKFSDKAKSLATSLSAIEKAHLYNNGTPPDRFTDKEKRLIEAELSNLATEFDNSKEKFDGIPGVEYEGRRGASAREIMSMINDAALNEDYECVSPLALIKEIENISVDDSLYDFLRLEEDWTYGSVKSLTALAEKEYQKWITNEIRESMNLVPEEEYNKIFERYILNVKAWKQQQKIENPQTGKKEDPNEDFMKEVENQIGARGTTKTFRTDLMLRIGTWAHDNKAWIDQNQGKPLPYEKVFSDLLAKYKSHYYKKVAKTVEAIQRNILKHDTEEWDSLTQAEQKEVTNALERLINKNKYCVKCAKMALSYLIRESLAFKLDL